MKKAEFLKIMATAYDFPKSFSGDLESADQCLDVIYNEAETDKLDLEPFLTALFADASPSDRTSMIELLQEYFLPDEEWDDEE